MIGGNRMVGPKRKTGIHRTEINRLNGTQTTPAEAFGFGTHIIQRPGTMTVLLGIWQAEAPRNGIILARRVSSQTLWPLPLISPRLDGLRMTRRKSLSHALTGLMSTM